MPAPRNPLSDAAPLPPPRNGCRAAQLAAAGPRQLSPAKRRGRSVSRSRSRVPSPSPYRGTPQQGSFRSEHYDRGWRDGHGSLERAEFHGQCEQVPYRRGYHDSEDASAFIQHSGRGRGNGGKVVPNSRVYVGNLPDDITEAALMRKFEAYGEVLGLKVIPARPGGGRTGAIIRYSASVAADTAIAALKDKHDVRYAKPNPRWDRH